ncbi:MAG TPA: DUF2252 family protein [Fimbriimonadaceae bacterium]|nr:DUF2252 family protein [Fimbriimonadaceae bacterium]
MKISKATAKYEAWLRQVIPVVEPDLDFKHEQMRSGAFPFFRATFYRWLQRFKAEVDSEGAPKVLAVGDLHVENFGTWRDAEGRLVWGINDFDEAGELPYTQDLIRLASSVELAVDAGHLSLEPPDACQAIVEGYRDALESAGRPFVLEADHGWLRRLATGVERAPDRFWAKMKGLPKLEETPVEAGLAALRASLVPQPAEWDLRSRRAGLGSLGHPRYVALVELRGAPIAREAKLLAPSSIDWVRDPESSPQTPIAYRQVVTGAVRSPDPFLLFSGPWVVRRLAPSCSRIELAMLPAEREELKLVRAMGFELGNVHLGSPKRVRPILKHLDKQAKKWLRKASESVTVAVVKDFETFRSP